MTLLDNLIDDSLKVFDKYWGGIVTHSSITTLESKAGNPQSEAIYPVTRRNGFTFRSFF